MRSFVHTRCQSRRCKCTGDDRPSIHCAQTWKDESRSKNYFFKRFYASRSSERFKGLIRAHFILASATKNKETKKKKRNGKLKVYVGFGGQIETRRARISERMGRSKKKGKKRKEKEANERKIFAREKENARNVRACTYVPPCGFRNCK